MFNAQFFSISEVNSIENEKRQTNHITNEMHLQDGSFAY